MFRVLYRIIRNASPRPNGDNIDRLNYSVTSNILVLLIILISIKQYVGEPIQCWIPAEFMYSWELYIERYCYIQNTYFVNETNLIMPSNEQKEKYELRYYQWVPVFLSVQMVLFILTRNFWSFASESTGLDVASITMTAPIQRFGQEKLKSVYSHFADRIYENLNFASKLYGKFWNIIPYTSYFTSTYLCYKLLSCVNVFFQLWMMNRYLNTEYGWLWGIGVLKDLIMERKWKSSGHFPRVTFCDFIRRDETSGAPLSFPVQCVLMINMFNELMYILLWFWFSFLAVINLISAIYWLFTSFSKRFRYMCIKDMLEYSTSSKIQQGTVEEFIESRIFWDGLLALRLLAINVGDRVTSGIVVEMLKDYLEEKEAAANESKKITGNNINWKSITLAKGNDGTNNSNDSGFDGGNGTNDSGFDGGNNNDKETVDAMILKKTKHFDDNTMIKCLREFEISNSHNPIALKSSEEFLKFLQTWYPKSANSSSSSDASNNSSDSDLFYDEERLLHTRKLQQMLISLDKETFQKIFKSYKRLNGDSDDDVEFQTVFDLYGMIDNMGPMIEAEYQKFAIRQKAAAAQKRFVQRKMPTVNDEKVKNVFYEDDQPCQSTFFQSKALSNPSKPPGIPSYRNPFVGPPPSESKEIVSEPVKSVAPEVPARSPFKAPSIKPVSSDSGLSTKNADENCSPKIETLKLPSSENSSTTPVLPDSGLGTKNADETHSPKAEKHVPTFDELKKEIFAADVAGEVPKPSSNKPVTTSDNADKNNVDAKNLKATVIDETHSPEAEKHVPTFDELWNERVVSAAAVARAIPELSSFEASSIVLPEGDLGAKNADKNRSPKIEKRVPTFDELWNERIVSAAAAAVVPEVPKPSYNKPVTTSDNDGTKNADANRSPKIEKRIPTFDELMNEQDVSANAAPGIPKISTFKDSSTSVLPDTGLGTKNADETHLPKAEKHVSTFDKLMKEISAAAVAPEVSKPSSNKPVTTSDNADKKNVDVKNLKATVIDETHSPEAEKNVPTFDDSAAAAPETPNLLTPEDSSTTPVLHDGGLGTKNAETCLPKIEKLVEIESMTAPVTATLEASQILTSEDSIEPKNFGMKNAYETVLPGLAFDHPNLPAELQTFVDLDEPTQMPDLTNEAFIPKVEVPLPTTNLNNFDDEIDQKPVAEIEAAVGFPGAGIWQGFKNMASSLFGTYAPAPSNPEDVSFENDESVDSIDVDFSIDEKHGIDKNEHFDNQQHEKYDNHENEADKNYINSIVNDIPHSSNSDTDKSVDSGFINQDTMIIPDNNYEALDSAKVEAVEKINVPSQSASDSHFASDAKFDESVVGNIIDKPSMEFVDLSTIDFDSDPKVIEATLENVVSYFDTNDPMPTSSTNEIHVPQP